jgi:hypothetical protein
MGVSSGRAGRFRVAVIIPLEYHRGVGLDCIAGWARRQDYPRENYQLLIGAPPNLDAKTLEELRGLIGPADQVLVFDHSHDMSLVEDTAKRADADLLLFSESHCIPEENALSYLVRVADEHPEWAALSAPTQGMTHNLLSQIECDIYSEDIRGKLSSHDWLRVLDQCFLIRHEAYAMVGGFRGAYGHFAEWLMAATLRVLNLRLGVADRTVVSHLYVGNFEDLEAFTTDFAYGQIKYMNECGCEPAAALFPSIPELEDFRRRTPQERRRLAQAVRDDLPRAITAAWRQRWSRETIGRMGEYARWIYRSSASHSAEQAFRYARADARRALAKLKKAIARGDALEGRTCFVEWFSRLVKQGRSAYLKDIVRGGELQLVGARECTLASCGSWAPDTGGSLAQLFNIHDAEGTNCGTIRWTHPVVQALLPLSEGRQRIGLEWMEARHLQPLDLLSLRVNGKRLRASEFRLEPTALTIDVQIPQTGWHAVSVSVYPFEAPGDGRLLGLPLKRVFWSCVNDGQWCEQEPAEIRLPSHNLN